MLKLTNYDLKIARPLSTILLVLSVLILGVSLVEIGAVLVMYIFVMLPIIICFVIFYALKLMTTAEQSFMVPAFLLAVTCAVIDVYNLTDLLSKDIFIYWSVGSYICIGIYHSLAFWGNKSFLPAWGRYATLVFGIASFGTAYFVFVSNFDLAQLLGLPIFIAFLVYFFALRQAFVKAKAE